MQLIYSNDSKMGKKGSWFSAIKKVFTHSSKEKVTDGTEKNASKGKKKNKGFGKLKHGDGHSFLPFVREPSSIEKILGEVEREHHVTDYGPSTQPEQPKSVAPSVTPPPVRTVIPAVRTATPPGRTTPPRDPSPPRPASLQREAYQQTPTSRNSTQPTPPRVPSPPARKEPPIARKEPPIARRVPTPPARREPSPPQAATPLNLAAPIKVPSSRFVQQRRPEPTLREQHVCATKIQAAYRGYMARRNFRALRGLVRLQGVMKGHSVKRQTSNALKCMQMLVRVQNQIQLRRIQMLENQVLQRQAMHKNDTDVESSFGKWMSENQEDWDDSTLTKEEREARMKRKFDAIVKRERAMAYAYSHQVLKSTPRLTNGAIADFQSGGYPYWWNWLQQRQVPPLTPSHPSRSPAIKNFLATPSRSTMDYKASPIPQSSNLGQLGGLGFDGMDTPTPRSTRSSIAPRSRHAKTPPSRFQQKYSRGSAATSPFNGGAFKDDDSLMSCPPFSGPRYMTPTVSANAKLKGIPDSPSSVTDDPRRRMSFPFTQGAGSFKWNKGKETSSSSVSGKKQSVQSVGNLSVDSSSVSMPANVGRKPFNRFV